MVSVVSYGLLSVAATRTVAASMAIVRNIESNASADDGCHR
jgi:hypothetical protein